MKRLFLFLFFLNIVLAVNAQKYMTKNGYIGFYSHTPMEDIKGDNNQVVGAIDISTGEMVFQALIKSFHFDRALMEEHFNENYMESSKFPKTKFKGTIDGFNKAMLKAPVASIKITGQLNVHGVEKTITVPGTIGLEDGKLVATAKFKVTPEEYGIVIPSLVRDKIGKEMEITVKDTYVPFGQ